MYEHDETTARTVEMDHAQATEEACVPETEAVSEAPLEISPDSDGLRDRECPQDRRDEGEAAPDLGAIVVDPEDPPQSPDPSAQALGSDQTADSELECIRRELSLLRAQLDSQSKAMQRIGIEYAEFCDLYPDQSPDELPDDVWESVRRGVPLSAAFALAERKRVRTQEKARQLNEENKRRSSGSVKGDTSDYFSPDEVRGMTSAEVRANYQKILLSMKKWR